MEASARWSNWWNGRVAVGVTTLLGVAYLLILVLPYLELETKAQAFLCAAGTAAACHLSTGIAVSGVAAVVFQYGFLALPCLVLALLGHHRTFALPLIVPAVGAMVLVGLRTWAFAFALPNAGSFSFMQRANTTWHWQAPVWEGHWAMASVIGFVLAALPAALVASRQPAHERAATSSLGERAVAVGAGAVLAVVSLVVIGLLTPGSWTTARIPEAYIVGAFVFAVVLGRSPRMTAVMCGTFGLLLWADVAVFTILRLGGMSGFLSSGLPQSLPTWLVPFAAVGIAGSLTGPITERLRKREAAKGLAAA